MRKAINQTRVRNWEAKGGVCCFVAGILAAFLGSALTASGWLVAVELHPWIHAAGTALLIATIPLILFAGFCLDWAERRPNKAGDNDRGQGERKTSPEPIIISKDIKRGMEKAGVLDDKEISVAVGENGKGSGTLNKTGRGEQQLWPRNSNVLSLAGR
jgi:hypothetical protein